MRAIELDIRGDAGRQRQLLAELLSESSDGGALHPLSFAQEGLWFIEQLELGTAVHNLTSGLRVYGPLDINSLQRAADAVTTRHEVLRTSFLGFAGEVFQHISAVKPAKFVIADLRERPPETREREAYDLASSEQRAAFKLQEGPLFRVKVIRLDDEHHILLFTMHHLVSDGWSLNVLVQELNFFYTAYAENKPCDLPPPPIQYSAFARWQRNSLHKGELERKLQYWKVKLAGAPPLLELPADRVRSAAQTPETASCSVPLPAVLSDRLATLAREERVTIFTVLLAAFFALLHRYSRQEDICIGVPVAGRDLLETEALIGFFVNTVVIRTFCAENSRFRQLLAQTQENLLEAYGNQEVPFERLVAELQPQRSLAYNPVFQVMMTMSPTPPEVQPFGTLHAVPYAIPVSGSRFDLTAAFHTASSGVIWCRFDYNTSLFDRLRISRMMEHFCLLLSSVVGNPEQRISDVDLSTPEERQQIAALNHTAVEYPSVCVHDLIAQQALATPCRVALSFENEQLTYAALQKQVERVAAALAAAGAGPGRRIAICLERSLEMVVGILAILQTGSCYVPLEPDHPVQRLRSMLEDADVSLVLTSRAITARLKPSRVCAFIDELMQAETLRQEPVRCDPESTAYITYTSGSTGTPKGVCVSHRSLMNLLFSMRDKPGFSPDDKLLAVTSISFDISALELLLPLITGAQVVIAGKAAVADSARLWDRILQPGITVVQTTPSRWRLLLEAGWPRETPWLRVWCGGEALSTDLAQELLQHSAAVWNLYGPTETTIWSSVCPVKKEQPVALGKPISNTQFYVLDRHLRPVPLGARGELYIGGDGLAQGYWQRPELTAQKFVQAPAHATFCAPKARLYRTGDEVMYRQDGEIEYIGRLDSQAKVRGWRIELGEIETALCEIPGVHQSVVVVREDRPGDQRLVAYVVPVSGVALLESQLQDALKRRLPEYMIPVIAFLDAMPLTPNGKIDRKRLPLAGAEKHSGVELPLASHLEKQLLAIWQEILGVAEIGLTDNFFDLGGYSLLAIRLLARVENVIGQRVTVASFLKAQTIKEMAALLGRPLVPSSSLIVEMKPGRHDRPLFVLPGASGDVLGYAELPRLLSSEQAVFGLQSVGLDGTRKPLERIEDIADVFLEEIRNVQPRGPYCLAGFCIGGIIAYEIAQRLVATGHEVSLLGLIETWPPSCVPLPSEDGFKQRALSSLRRFPGHLRTAAHLPRRQGFRYLAQRFTSLFNLVSFTQADAAKRIDRDRDLVLRANHRAASRYHAARYAGRVVIFVPGYETVEDTNDPRLFWGRLADKGAHVLRVSGDRGNLLERPHVEVLAQHLSEQLLELQLT